MTDLNNANNPLEKEIEKELEKNPTLDVDFEEVNNLTDNAVDELSEGEEDDDEPSYEGEVTNCPYTHYKLLDESIIEEEDLVLLSQEEIDNSEKCTPDGEIQQVECDVNWDAKKQHYHCSTCNRTQ